MSVEIVVVDCHGDLSDDVRVGEAGESLFLFVKGGAETRFGKDFESVVGFAGSRIDLEDREFALAELFVDSERLLAGSIVRKSYGNVHNVFWRN